jgi:hypothetical protein
MKKYILMTAATQSEWDAVEFALLEFSIEELQDFLKKSKQLEEMNDVDALIVNEDAVTFYNDQDALPERIKLVPDEVIVVELSDEEVNALPQPEQTIKYGQTVFSLHSVTFKGTGKHTGEEYWCDMNWDQIAKMESENK